MRYEYRCTACSQVFDVDVPIGKASVSVSVSCSRCQAPARRSYSGINFSVTGGSVSTSATGRTMGQEMLRRNTDAGKRMKANRPPVRRVGTEYRDGRVTEFAK